MDILYADRTKVGDEFSTRIVAAIEDNRCLVSHYVKYQDEDQQVTDYDYYWCNTHACICDPDGCRWGKTANEDEPDDYELGNIGYPSVADIINKMGYSPQED